MALLLSDFIFSLSQVFFSHFSTFVFILRIFADEIEISMWNAEELWGGGRGALMMNRKLVLRIGSAGNFEKGIENFYWEILLAFKIF